VILNPPPKLVTQRRTVNGFSLLELLVVIVIVGILFSFTTLAIRGTNPDELIEEEARRFDQLTRLALEEAILKGLEYGIAFTPNSYTFLVQLTDLQWHDLGNDKLLRPRELSHDIEIELNIEDTDVVFKNASTASGEPEETTADTDENDEDQDESTKIELKPQVYLLSSGEITPEFSARFIIPGVTESHQVNGFVDGKHEVVRSE
jgi:general secretion pathway protein H